MRNAKSVVEWTIGMTGVCCCALGVILLLAARQDLAILRRSDVMFEIPNWMVLFIGGSLHLGIAVLLFAIRPALPRSVILIWHGFNALVYRQGLLWLHASVPLPLVHILARQTGLKSQTVDICWKCFIAWLFFSGFFSLCIEWKRLQQKRAEAYAESWQAMREHGQEPNGDM